MSELDLGLKVAARSLLWSMGYSTRLDVELRGDAQVTSRSTGGRPSRRPAAPETFTDLDVLGVMVTGGYQLTTTIADCKSGQRDKPTARMFWARGVADLFGADQVMLVREHDVNDATRQLSARLGITVLPTADLTLMQTLHGHPLANPQGPLALLFAKEAVARHLAAFDNLDRRLKPLLEYRQFDYWVYDHHRNPIQLVAHLQDAAPQLDPANPVHLALFLDLAWLYLLTLVRVTQHLRGAFLTDPDRGLQEYLFGGATGLKEKTEVAALLSGVAPPGTPPRDHLPPYYRSLRELVTRLLRRPAQMQTSLRYIEAASALMAARQRIPMANAVGEDFDVMSAKLAADVCGFLVAAGGLDSQFRVQARAYLLAEPVAGSASEPGGSTVSGLASTDGEGSTDSARGSHGSKEPSGEPDSGMKMDLQEASITQNEDLEQTDSTTGGAK